MHTLYQMQDSGNCYKLRLAMAQLGIPFKISAINILKAESRTPEFLALNPNGRVPTLELDDGRVLAESNAAMCYLATGSDLVPSDAFEYAQMLQWMFFEQYSHEPYIAVARFWLHVVDGREEKADRLPEWKERGYQALAVMDRHLGDIQFFAAGRYTLADISLYAYTHIAHQGEFDVSPYGNVTAWLERVASQPGHVDMNWQP